MDFNHVIIRVRGKLAYTFWLLYDNLIHILDRMNWRQNFIWPKCVHRLRNQSKFTPHSFVNSSEKMKSDGGFLLQSITCWHIICHLITDWSNNKFRVMEVLYLNQMITDEPSQLQNLSSFLANRFKHQNGVSEIVLKTSKLPSDLESWNDEYICNNNKDLLCFCHQK